MTMGQGTHYKVHITQTQATTIEGLRVQHYDYEIVESHIREEIDNSHPLGNLSTEKLICALYIGYEVAQTPEEQLAEWYKGLNGGAKAIVEIALQKLDLKVNGIPK